MNIIKYYISSLVYVHYKLFINKGGLKLELAILVIALIIVLNIIYNLYKDDLRERELHFYLAKLNIINFLGATTQEVLIEQDKKDKTKFIIHYRGEKYLALVSKDQIIKMDKFK